MSRRNKGSEVKRRRNQTPVSEGSIPSAELTRTPTVIHHTHTTRKSPRSDPVTSTLQTSFSSEIESAGFPTKETYSITFYYINNKLVLLLSAYTSKC